MKKPRKMVVIPALILFFAGVLVFLLINFPQILYIKDETYVHNPRGICQLSRGNDLSWSGQCGGNGETYYCDGKVIEGECWVPRFNFLKSDSENNY